MSDFGSEGGGYVPSQSQATTKLATGMPGSAALKNAFAGNSGGGLRGSQSAQPVPPRSVGSISEELVQRPVKDILAETGSFFDLNRLLEINPQVDNPEDQTRKQQIHSKWQSLSQAEQQVASQRYQELMRKRKAEQEEQARSRQQHAQGQQLIMPTSPEKGAKGPGGGNKKKMMTQQLNQNRQSFNKTQSSG